jgi:uncharacterized repeat protein (TIGR01451 family)
MFHDIRIKTLAHIKTLMIAATTGALLLSWLAGASTSWAQTPRPTLTPEPTLAPTLTPVPTDEPAPEPTGAPEIAPETMSTYQGPTLKGRVLNLGTGASVADATVIFSTGDVSVEVLSDANGQFAFGYLGTANGTLNVVPPSESGLTAVTTNVGVQPKTGVETVVNLGLRPQGAELPPLIPTIQASPSYVGAGDFVTITIMVKNSLPYPISGATVTDWLPNRVIPVEIHSSTGNPYFSDHLAVVELGSLDAGSGALIEIVAQVSSGQMSSSVLQGNASFYYRENAAAQPLSAGSLNGAVPTVLPVTGVGAPVLALGLVIVVILAGWMRRRVHRTLSMS